MTRGSVHVIRPGLQTTVQDLGRRGYQAYGVPVAGPMDPFAHRRANALVGNSREAATLEIGFVGPELVFEDERVVATAGAMFALTVESHGVPHDQPFVVPAGAHLRFGARTRGVRAYLAVGGGFDVPVVMGSRSTYLEARMGGHHGRTLMAGDRLLLGDAPRNATAPRRTLVPEFRPEGGTCVRVLPGPHGNRFAGDALDVLQAQPYEITADSNRMGFRLRGAPLTHTRGADLISESTTWGGLQVPASGQPILLMADRQTTGGYPIVATVITADLPVAAQAAPGDSLRFAICSRAEALSALLAAERALLVLENGA